MSSLILGMFINNVSNDATVQEIEDSKYKKLDGFKDLIEFLNGGKKKAAAEPAVKSPAKKAKK